MDKLKMHTPNIADENYKKLVELFPDAVTEIIDENGKIIRAIDKDILMQEINSTVVDKSQERYQFTWPDKRKSVILANAPIAKTLRLDKEKSVGRNGTPGNMDSENIYIEGDNLDALKLLQETYLGKVKMIYIDPPYNTGNDFIYEDDFSQSAGEYADNSGQTDEEGNRLVQNSESNGRYHTDWLNMMYPRLKLAKDLLSEDGAIFISIDDGELYNLKKMADEIFGDRNYVTNLIWQSTPGSNTGEDIKTVTENILLYCKNKDLCKFSTIKINDSSKYSNKDEYFEKRGGYVLNKLDRRMTGSHYSESLNYKIEMPNHEEIFPGGKNTKQSHWNWRWSRDKVEWGIKNGFIVMKESSNGWSVYFKQYEKVDNSDNPITRSVPYQNLISIEGANSARGTREVMNLFNGKYFDYPKPLNLMKYIQNMILKDKDIVFDFFSGSATTAHAVMQLNAENKTYCKFIMVQLPEKTDEKSDMFKTGYKTICDIGEERIRRAGKKIKEETGADIDYGFRCFKVDSSNMKEVYYSPADLKQEQLSLLSDNIKEGRKPTDLLIQTMLDLGIDLSSKIETEEMDGEKVFSVADGYLLACFDQKVGEETIINIAKRHPFYAVFRDNGMANDSVATNFEQIFETYSPETVRRVL